MQIFISIACLVLGVSFFWKSIQAVLFGKLAYWEGFLPITLISPLFIHLPAGKKSLIKTTQQWWIHLTAGPLFFVISLCLLAAGADGLGLPGTDYINMALTMGRTDVPKAITYDREKGYSFPIFSNAGTTLVKMMSAPVLQDQEAKDRLINTQ